MTSATKYYETAFVFDLDDTLFPTTEHSSWISSVSRKYSLVENKESLMTMAAEYKKIYTESKHEFQNQEDQSLLKMMEKLKKYPKFILSNATYGHCYACLHAQNIGSYFHAIIDRNVGYKFWGIPYQKFFKPNPMCYQVTQTYIETYLQNMYKKPKESSSLRIFFFDDKIENLLVPHQLDWITIYIGKEVNSLNHYLEYSFISMYFPTIQTALKYIISHYDINEKRKK